MSSPVASVLPCRAEAGRAGKGSPNRQADHCPGPKAAGLLCGGSHG